MLEYSVPVNNMKIDDHWLASVDAGVQRITNRLDRAHNK
jgi:hypothetical protein